MPTTTTIKVGNKRIGEGHPIFIIAEAGVNHNGSIVLARRLVDAAAGAGADAVKFQSFKTELLIRRDAPKAKYQDRNVGARKSQFTMLKELELDGRQTREIKAYCDRKRILFLSTPYDFESLQMLADLGVAAYKIASMDVVHHRLLEMAAATGKPVVLSTGMATAAEIAQAAAIFRGKDLILLQCNTNYPSPAEDQNLRALAALKAHVPIVGFSDHTQGSEASIAAVALGAKVIERHLTLDRNMKGPDHNASLDPKSFSAYVRSVRLAEAALGAVRKKPSGGEIENMAGMRRSICAKTDLPARTVLTEACFAYKRPGDGLAPTSANIKRLVGRKARRAIVADENITFEKVT